MKFNQSFSKFFRAFAADDDGPLMKFRNVSKSVVDWKDLIDLYEFGISVGREGNILLALFNEILARHDSHVQLRKSWRDIRLAIDKQKSRKCYHVFTLTEPLPPRFFGDRHYLSNRPLRKFTGTSEDIREVIAEILLNVSPTAFKSITITTPNGNYKNIVDLFTVLNGQMYNIVWTGFTPSDWPYFSVNADNTITLSNTNPDLRFNLQSSNL